MSDAFTELGLDPRLAQTLAGLGYEEPTPIQQQAIPPLLEGRDVLGQAATGTGKTAAFSLPLLQRLVGGTRATGRAAKPRLLVLVPTRELAMQVAEALFRYGQGLDLRVMPVYGGQPIERQLRRLKQGADIVVATPGRAVDLLRRKALDLSNVQAVVLDEADEMLDMGFAEDLDAILNAAPKEGRQTALFSATLAPHIARIAEKHLQDPLRIQTGKPSRKAAASVRQVAYVVARHHKVASLMRVLDVERPSSALVFCRTRLDVEQLAEALNTRGYQAEALHGGISQEQRDRVMRRFRDGTADLLIATNVAARGIDVPHLSHVINFEIPSSSDDYVHRIGRTARAGREGVAITLVEPREHRLLRSFETASKGPITTATLPTVADLRARQLELTRASLREALVGNDLDRYRMVLESLSSEFEVMEIALAAIKLAHQSSGGDREEVELPDLQPQEQRKRGPHGRAGAGRAAPGRGPAGRAAPGRKPPHPREAGRESDRSRPGRYANQGPTARLYVGAGRQEGIRPADLVGAIANEAGLSSRDIGSIEIADDHAVVELPEAAMDHVVQTMQRASLRGMRVTVGRDRVSGSPQRADGDGTERRDAPRMSRHGKAKAAAAKSAKVRAGKPTPGKKSAGKAAFTAKPGKAKPGKAKPGKPKPGKPGAAKATASKAKPAGKPKAPRSSAGGPKPKR